MKEHENSLTTRRYKIGLIKCLANRIWRICSEHDQKLVELDKLKQLLILNAYPQHIIEEEIAKFIKNQGITKEPKVKIPYKKFIVLPYANRNCEEFATRLKNLLEQNYSETEFNVAFQTPSTIGKLFPFKDNIKVVTEKSFVVYKISCKEMFT